MEGVRLSDIILPSVLAFAIGGIIAFWELVTSKYPRTFFLALRCGHAYFYAMVYAIAALLIMLLYEAIVPHNGPHSYLGGNLWVRAIGVGLFTKSFLHLRIFTIPGHPEPTPIGLETIMLIFIPYLLREVELGHDRREMAFVKDRVHCLSFTEVSQAVAGNLPDAMAPRDRQGFIASVKKAKHHVRAARLYLRLVGRGHFEMVFPPGTCKPRQDSMIKKLP